MRIHPKHTMILAALVAASVIPIAAQVPTLSEWQLPATEEELAAVRHFEEQVVDYAALHHLLEASLPPQGMAADMSQVQANTLALAARIRFARQAAQPGDIFSRDVAPVLRRRIAACLSPEEWAAVLAEHAVDEDGNRIVIPVLRVNMEWPQQVPFNFVPPQLLRALPKLPPELQYRIIGRSLVLWDHHANLIVDILPGAFTT